MKILVISTPIFKLPCVGYAGLEHLAWLRAKHLAERGHEVALVCPDGSQCPGVTILPIGPERQVSEEQAYSKYWQYLPSFDVIIDESWGKYSLTLKAEGRLKVPVLCWTHAPVNTMFGSLPPVEKPCFVCISQDQQRHFEALFGKPARYCYNGICTDTYQSINIPRTNRYLFLGRFSTIKGPDLAIEACQWAGTELDLIGDTSITAEPEFFTKCQQMVNLHSSQRPRQVEIRGSCSRGETVFWYSQAKAFLHLNQRFREPFGLAPVEAQACGLPVIAWRYGSLPEIVRDKETGFLVDSLDEVIDLLKSDAVHTIDRSRCRQWAATFGLTQMIQRVEELCNEAVSTGGW